MTDASENPGGLAYRRVVVEVPATTANLGAGYDALALALDIRNRIEVNVVHPYSVDISIQGQGSRELPSDRSNRFLVALETGLRWALGSVPEKVGWRIAMVNAIPLARGLGSSAAATVAGLLAADALTGGKLDRRRMLGLAAEMEGHPDNAAAALLGGFVVVALLGGQAEAIRFDPPRDLRAVLFVPEQPLATSAMRAALPHEVPHRDAVFNVGRVAIGVAAIATGRFDLLKFATEDRLHEPYRAAVYPALPRLVQAARDAGAMGACLSGSGSTVIAFGDTVRLLTRIEGAFVAAAAELDVPGTVQIATPRSAGAAVVQAR
ncbi:MAG: homoserine kinase [Candidatus Limnocylindrales bacterium]